MHSGFFILLFTTQLLVFSACGTTMRHKERQSLKVLQESQSFWVDLYRNDIMSADDDDPALAQPKVPSYSFNTNTKNHHSISYTNPLFSVGIGSTMIAGAAPKENRTNAQSVRLEKVFDSVLAVANYHNAKGFVRRIDNQEDLGLVEKPVFYPDMQATQVSVAATVIVSPDSFSIAALTDQSEMQVESGGSFLYTIAGDDMQVHNPDPLLPADAAEHGYKKNINGYRKTGLRISGGYGYTHTFLQNLRERKMFYLTHSVTLGAGRYRTTYNGEENFQKPSASTLITSLFATGMNWEQFFLGVKATRVTNAAGLTEGSGLDTNFHYYQGFLGMRF